MRLDQDATRALDNCALSSLIEPRQAAAQASR
jgi:hypothetical protein